MSKPAAERPSEAPTLPPSAQADEAATLPPEAPAEVATLPPAHAGVAADLAISPDGPPATVPGYEILGELGRGGMGVVYKARQTALQRLVALKMILAGGHAGADGLQRFRTEAEAIARLQHPHIVQIHEVGEHQGLPYFSLELCSGGSLEKKLQGTPLPPKQAAALVEQLAQAMQAAHQKGVIHRDLKPANVLLTEEGVPKITDFGLAKKLDEAGRTASGAVMGTPSYMAPEQAGGQSQELRPACDVYALGAILYECLTGRPPFRAATPLDTILQVVSQEPVSVTQLNGLVPRDLETICLKCLQKEPRKRYASAAALAEDLRRFQAGEPITARPVGRGERLVKWVKRRPAVAALLGVVVLLTAAGLGGIAWAYGEAVRERIKAQELAEDMRRHLAISQVMLAEAAWREGHVVLARDRLSRVPGDLRCWEWYFLNRSSTGGLFTLTGHTGGVASVCASPDGQRLATGSNDGTAKVWDARTGQELLTLRVHTGLYANVEDVCFSPDGQRLATVSQAFFQDSPVRVCDARTGQLLLVLGQGNNATSICFSPDGQRLVTGGRDATATLWDARTGQELLVFKGHTASVRSVSFSPDGQRVATGSEDYTVRVWDAHTGNERLTIKQPGGRYVRFSPDGRRLAVDTGLWDAQTGKRQLTFKSENNLVTGVSFSPDGQRVVTGNSYDQTATVWDAQTGEAILTLRGHRKENNAGCFSVCFSPEGQRLITGGQDRTARVWDARPGRELVTVKEHKLFTSKVSLSPNGQRLATPQGWFNSAEVRDARTGQLHRDLKGHTAQIVSVCFSPDGQHLASGSKDRTVKLWEVETGQERLTLQGHTDEVFLVCFSADGQSLATASADKTVKVWDARTGRERLTLKGQDPSRTCVFLSADGQRLATSSNDKTVKLWDVRTGRELYTLEGHTSSVSSVCFCPDGKRLATSSDDQTARVWDAETGREFLVLQGHTARVLSVCFSPDGKRLATASQDETVKVWDARTGQELVTLKGQARQRFSNVCFNGDGQCLAAFSGMGAKLWHGWRTADPSDAEERLIRRDCTRLDTAWHRERGALYEQEQNALAATFHLEQALAVEWYDRALAARLEQALSSVIQQQPESAATWRRLALVQLHRKQADAFQATCRTMQQRFRVSGDSACLLILLGSAPPNAASAALTAQLLCSKALPPSTSQHDGLLAMRVAVLRPNVLAQPASWLSLLPPGEQLLRGAVLCRAGHHAEAVQELSDEQTPFACLFRALAEHGRGHRDAARQALDEAVTQLPPEPLDLLEHTPLPWADYVEISALRAELELLQKSAP